MFTLKPKSTWKPVTKGRLYDLYEEVIEQALQLNWKPARIPPLYTKRSCAIVGECAISRNRATYEVDMAIILNERLVEFSDDQIRATIVHEVAHAMNPDHHHDYRWKCTAFALGKKWNYPISRLCTDEAIIRAISEVSSKGYKYELYCPTCGTTWKYRCKCNAVQHPERYVCGKDKSKLISRKINSEVL